MVHNCRIENVEHDVRPDFVTARALADLKTLLEYVQPWVDQNPNLECLFLKGAKSGEEIEGAVSFFDFDVEQFPSVTDAQARVVYLKNIIRKN